MLRALGASLIVDVGERVEFVHDNVDVVATYAVTLTSNAFAFIVTSDSMELAALHFTFNGIEVGSNSVYTSRVANEDDSVGQLLWFQMQMET